MFARKQKLRDAMDPASQWPQEPLLDKSNNEKIESNNEKVEYYSFQLGLMIGSFIASSVFMVHFLTLCMFGGHADPEIMFSVIWSCSTSVIINVGFLCALDRLIYPLWGDPSKENEIITWHTPVAFCLGTLISVCSAWVLMDILLGVGVGVKHSAGMLVGVMMLSLIFHFLSGNNHRQVTLFGSLLDETNKLAPISSAACQDGIMDPVEMRCAGEVHSDTFLFIV
jgi:hypothetical protein